MRNRARNRALRNATVIPTMVASLGIGCATLRAFGYVLGFASLGVGFAPVAFGGAGLHDRIAGTRVVRVK